MTKILKDRVALVTGASRGIGAAAARALAKEGAHVVLAARTIGALEALDDEIKAAGGSATLMPLDLLDMGKIDAMGPALAEKFGRLDILIGNAGMLGTLTSLDHADAKEWQRVMDLNVTANFRLIRTLHPLLAASDAGRAVFVTSVMADLCEAYWGAYAASKAALDAMVKTYAAETVKTKIRVNLLNPGLVDTAMLARAYPGGYQGGGVKKPEDVAPAILSLVSPSCSRHGEILQADDLLKRAA